MKIRPQDPVPDLTLRDIARIRRCSVDTVRRHHAAWSRNAGFPAAVSLEGVRGLRWNAAAVAAWQLQAAAGGRAAATGAGQGTTPMVTDWHAVAAARGALLDQGLDPDTLNYPRLVEASLPASR